VCDHPLFGIHAVHFGFLEQHAVPLQTCNPGHADLVQLGTATRGEPVAALAVFTSIGVPRGECSHMLVVVVLQQTFVSRVVSRIIYGCVLE